MTYYLYGLSFFLLLEAFKFKSRASCKNDKFKKKLTEKIEV